MDNINAISGAGQIQGKKAIPGGDGPVPAQMIKHLKEELASKKVNAPFASMTEYLKFRGDRSNLSEKMEKRGFENRNDLLLPDGFNFRVRASDGSEQRINDQGYLSGDETVSIKTIANGQTSEVVYIRGIEGKEVIIPSRPIT